MWVYNDSINLQLKWILCDLKKDFTELQGYKTYRELQKIGLKALENSDYCAFFTAECDA